MMNEPDGPEDHVPEKDRRDLKRFSELVQIYDELDSDADAPVAPTLLSGPLLVMTHFATNARFLHIYTCLMRG